MRRLGLLILLTLVGAPLVNTAFAQPAAPAQALNITAAENADIERRIRRMSEELHSPFCPGKSLMACTSFQAYQLRQEMVVMARSGKNDDQIIADLKVRYGTEVANPPQPWYTALVPFLPYIFGAAVLLLVARRWMIGARDEPESPEIAPDGDGAERLARLRARVAQHDDE